jgi:DNA-binding NtrC family response regulator
VIDSASNGFQVGEVIALASLETRYLDWAKTKFGKDLAGLAQALGVSQRTLYRKISG